MIPVLAMGFALGVGATFAAQYVYVRRQMARERESLIDLREARTEVPGGVVIELYRYQKRKFQ